MVYEEFSSFLIISYYGLLSREYNLRACKQHRKETDMNIGMICIVAAAVCFGLATAGIAVGGVALVPLGLALFAVGHVV